MIIILYNIHTVVISLLYFVQKNQQNNDSNKYAWWEIVDFKPRYYIIYFNACKVMFVRILVFMYMYTNNIITRGLF